jgi:hypothetical protein
MSDHKKPFHLPEPELPELTFSLVLAFKFEFGCKIKKAGLKALPRYGLIYQHFTLFSSS